MVRATTKRSEKLKLPIVTNSAKKAVVLANKRRKSGKIKGSLREAHSLSCVSLTILKKFVDNVFIVCSNSETF